MQKNKILTLKFGGACNLSCPHCHCMPLVYTYNPDIIDWINRQQFKRIFLSGGEPFLYFNLMKKIIPKLNVIEYSTTSNGTILTDEIVNFCNQYNISVNISYDGQFGQRDAILPDMRQVKKLNKIGIASVCYHENMNIQQMDIDIRLFLKQNNIKFGNYSRLIPAFVHQTTYAPNIETTREDAKSYVQQIAPLIELGIIHYKNTDNILSLDRAFRFIRRYLKQGPFDKGVVCCNPHHFSMAIDGRFILCPYENKYVGDIYTGIDWDKVQSYIPNRCKKCDLYPICGGNCIANITDNECYIFRCLYRHYKKLLKKYHIDEEELLNRPEWKEE